MNFIQRIMSGRYGGDHLSVFLFALYLILYLVAAIFRIAPLSWLALVLAAWACFRIFSRNVIKRRAENEKFLSFLRPIYRRIKLLTTKRKDKEHQYFTCPNCGQTLRVPKGKGRINIHCRCCGVEFEANS